MSDDLLSKLQAHCKKTEQNHIETRAQQLVAQMSDDALMKWITDNPGSKGRGWPINDHQFLMDVITHPDVKKRADELKDAGLTVERDGQKFADAEFGIYWVVWSDM